VDILRSDIKRALTSWGFWAGSAGMVVAILIGASGAILPIIQEGPREGLMYGFHAETLLSALSSDVMLLCVPILCALPYTAAFIEDYKSGYIKEYLPRAGKKQYLKGKVVSTALSGGLVLFVGIMAAYLVFALVFTPMELAPNAGQEAIQGEEISEESDVSPAEGMDAGPDMGQQSFFMDILGRAFVFFLCGSLWSLTGALLASVTMSRYMAYASPFIIYYVLVILSERYFKDLYVFNPQEWLKAQDFWPGGMWGVALLLIEIIAILSIAFSTSMKRRISDA
jgi:hypothetical protein